MPRVLKSSVSFAKTTLPYPLFAAEFDPYNRGYLVVGGGGGESKTGVPNQISVLDISNRGAITTAASIDLSRDEDSVQSLASLATKDGLIAFAGINSSEADQNAGKNEHFRAFEVKYPPRKKQKTEKDEKGAQGQIKPLGKRALLKPSQAVRKETYQRLIRLSPAQIREQGSKRVGAIASGMAGKQSEVVVFNATTATPDDKDIIARIDVANEAVDLDIIEPETSEFSITFCTDYDIYEQTIKYNFKTRKAEKTPKGPRKVYEMPAADGGKSRPKFRALRFLNAENVIALVNKPDKSGVELRIIHLYPTGPAFVIFSKSLPGRVKQAVSMDVCGLDTDKAGNQQFVLAVAGQDISIEVLTINYKASSDTFSPFNSYMAFREVHEHQMTKLCFSPFQPPVRGKDAGPQYLRLASVSYGNTVVVDTLPVSPLNSNDKESRYLLSHPSSEKLWTFGHIGAISVIVLLLAFFAHSFYTNPESQAAVYEMLPQNVQSMLGHTPYVPPFPHTVTKVVKPAESSPVARSDPVKIGLKELVDEHITTDEEGGAPPKAVIVKDTDEGLDLAVHYDKDEYLKEDTDAKHWHELEDHQKSAWKEKLKKAGHWAESQGESYFLGVLFTGYAGMVGQIAREAMNG